MTLILDAGALLAYERGDRTVQAHLERASRTGTGVRTTTGVVAQVWRNAARQARIARLLRGVAEIELDRAQTRRVGTLLGAAGCSDVVDGSVVDAAMDGDEILTGDLNDITTLASSSGKTLIVTRV